MGRPKKPEGQKGIQVNIRLPSAALKFLQDEAVREGLTTATLAQKILMNALATRVFGG